MYQSGRKGRRTGLGITALADALAALNLKYDSQEALEVVEKIMKTKCRAEFDSSIDLAIERGKFEDFNPVIENTSEFVQMMKQEMPDVYARMMQFGRRSISISTVAPTGTLSLLAQTSSGIEPVLCSSNTRRRKVNKEDPHARIDFVDPSGDAWQEFTVYHQGLKRWMELTGNQEVAESPYYKATAPKQK